MLNLMFTLPVRVQNAGRFISRGIGTHPTRRLDSFELIYVERGQLALREETQAFYIPAGSSLLLWPGRQHSGIGPFPPDLIFYWLHFEVFPAETPPVNSQLFPVPQQVKIQQRDEVAALFRLFLSEQARENTAALPLILLLLLQQVAAAAASPPEATAGSAALAWQARQIIKTQFHRPLAASALAQQLHCNPDYLGRVFRATFHQTLTEAIHQQRIRCAEALLREEQHQIATVARRAGFDDPGYFRRVFRKLKGMSPLAYRRLYCKEHINSD
ncbi:AraC family transcriptional regulator [Chimaeribacter arupi]|uniref:helix-turn-helix transcriptional regulator n=1 Tax=Chimaeribacter arupi TaxID=2060066 RepID=UPI002711DAA5|nr:AraC family transcriptional regulator [Chimaeribacter arupi]WKZ91297.1 AraC family transcriptional regulator [Chimaeribacter arupi]